MNKIEKLNIYLADLNVLYRKVQNFHWYVIGKNFFTAHEKLEEMYDSINDQIDVVAERILALNEHPYGSMKKYLEVTNINENEDKFIESFDALRIVFNDFQTMIKTIREIKILADEENDYGTSALMDEHITYYEKMSWMLNAYLR